MRVLKTKFPCRICEAPAEVDRLRDGHRAICDKCAHLSRLLMLVNFAYRNGGKAIKNGRGADDDLGLVRFWATGLGEYLKGIARCMEAMPAMSPRLRRIWAKEASSTLRWVSKRAAELVPFAEEVATDTFEIVPGGQEALTPPLEMPSSPPRLCVVPREPHGGGRP